MFQKKIVCYWNHYLTEEEEKTQIIYLRYDCIVLVWFDFNINPLPSLFFLSINYRLSFEKFHVSFVLYSKENRRRKKQYFHIENKIRISKKQRARQWIDQRNDERMYCIFILKKIHCQTFCVRKSKVPRHTKHVSRQR